MDELIFHGYVAPGMGKHNELGIPGRLLISATAPTDWPERLQPGSLNIRLFADRIPREFSAHGLPPTVTSLDAGRFQPEFEIPQARIANNTIAPDRVRGPRGGDAQVWRAFLSDEGRALDIPQAWVLRRFGSQVGEQLELVSGSRLRDTPGIENDRVVAVRILGRWQTSS